MKKLSLIGVIIVGLMLAVAARSQNSVAKIENECQGVFPFLACDTGRFACRLNIAISSGNYRCAKRIASEESDGFMYLPTKSLPPDSIPLIVAARRGLPEIVELVLGYNSDLEIRDNVLELTPLLWASNPELSRRTDDKAPLKVVDLLIRHGANIDASDKLGNTSLIIGVSSGAYELAEMLIENGAAVNIQNKRGATALMLAPDDPKILELLTKSNHFTRDDAGRTAVFYAIEQCQPRKLQFLINRNPALLKIPDLNGVTPSALALSDSVQESCPQISRLFQSAS